MDRRGTGQAMPRAGRTAAPAPRGIPRSDRSASPVLSAESGGGMTERVLIVVDHPLTRDALARLLAQRGLGVLGQEGSGEEAIARAAELTPDIVLLDLSMP